MEMYLSVKCLLHQLKELHSDPSTHIPSEALVVRTCKPVAGGGDRRTQASQSS